MDLPKRKKVTSAFCFNLTTGSGHASCNRGLALKMLPFWHKSGSGTITKMLMLVMMMAAATSGTLPESSYAGTHDNLSYFVLNVTNNGGADEEMERDTLYVLDFVLASDVVEREPVEIVQSYSKDDARAWCFARIHNSEMMQNIFFEWYFEEELYFEMSTKIGVSSHWRTYSSVSIQPGQWRVVLKNRHGETLDHIRFQVTE